MEQSKLEEGQDIRRLLLAFGDLTLEEIAKALKISRTTVAEDWALARVWLHRELTR